MKDQNFKVPVTKILDIYPHPNPKVHSLQIAKVYDFDVVISSSSGYKKGNYVVYFPVNSVLPADLESFLFPPDSKIKLDKSRIKAIKIHQFISQGMIVPLEKIVEFTKLEDPLSEDQDLQEILRVIRHRPHRQKAKVGTPGLPKQRTKIHENEFFKEYKGCTNLKWVPNVFSENEDVVIQEKIHGCVRFDTKIQTVKGDRIRICDIVDHKLDVEIWGLDEEKNKLVPTKITNWFQNGRSHDWLKIKISRTKSGRGNHYQSIHVTPNHRFYTSNKGYIPASSLEINDTVFYFRHDYQLTYIQSQILIGIMLGDGSLSNSCIRFGHKNDHREYLQYILDSLGDIAGNIQKDAMSGYGTVMSRGRTISLDEIKNLFIDWFFDGNKEVPESIRLSPISLAFWYMDDGSLSHHADQEDRAHFAVCGFNDVSVQNLLNALLRIGIQGISYKDSEGYNRIRLNADEAEKMFTIIAPYIPECMKYKIPERFRHWPTVNFPNQVGLYKPKLTKQKIISIEKWQGFYPHEMIKYDLETETHNYLANGILVHNSNFRCGYMPKTPTPWKSLSFKEKLKKVFQFWKWNKKEEEFEFCYGSNHVQRQNKRNSPTWHGSDKYYQMIEKYDLENKLKDYPGFEIFGEIYGPSIQKGYHYGLKNDEIDLVIYDALYQTKTSSDWVNLHGAITIARELGLKFVPVLYNGKWNKDLAVSFATGDSVFCKEQKCIEGVVVKNHVSSLERKKIKIINPEYTLKESTGETTENDDLDDESEEESALENGQGGL